MEKALKVHPIFAFAAIVLLTIIMYLSLLPKIELPETNLIQADKLVHASMYFILSLSIFKGFFNTTLKKSIGIACLLSFLYGIIVEFAQDICTLTRMFDVFDILANGFGSILAYLVVSKYLST
ncbi:MAG: VanZ family protein [Chitinophagales bacterium]|nr:VanZ family protein [Chitinophagales bacterium]